MENRNKWFGVALYGPHIDEEHVEEWVRRILVDSNGVICGIPLAQVSITTTKGTLGRPRVVNEKTLRDILSLTRQGRVSDMLGFDKPVDPNEYLTRLELLYLMLSVTPMCSFYARRLMIEGPRSLYLPAELQGYVRSLLECFEVDYGCIAAGLTQFHVDATISYTHSAYADEHLELRRRDPNHPRFQFAREISYYQSKQQMLGQHIPRASWGNILSPTHVEALGGVERIKRESGAFLVEKWGHNLYVQLTGSPWDCTNEQLLWLNHFFGPARFPGAPDPVYLDIRDDPYPKG